MIIKISSDTSHLFIQRDDRVILKIPLHDQLGMSHDQHYVVVRSYADGPEAFIYDESGYLTDALYAKDGHYVTKVSHNMVTSVEAVNDIQCQVLYQEKEGKFIKLKAEILR